MSYADLSQARLYYVIDGPADAPCWYCPTRWAPAPIWARQIPELSRRFPLSCATTRAPR